MSERPQILAFVDAPDPDNFVQILALHKLNPTAEINVAITGRPVKFGADKTHQTWEWDLTSSRMAQEASAMRLKNFLKYFNVSISRVFDGGIAPRTLVPHWVHFAEYYKFNDVDPLQAIRHSELEPQEDLVKLMLAAPPKSIKIAVGGPMTGLYQTIVRCPEVASRISELHAMFATWERVALMEFGDKPRGKAQFNVACDPQAAHFVLYGLDCPIYLMPTEVTRVKEIGFLNAQRLFEFLPNTAGTRALYTLYAMWYDAAVKPRQEKDPNELIFIHDLVAALSLDEKLRKAIYKVAPIDITNIPYLPNDAENWGRMEMKEKRRHGKKSRPIFAATGLNAGGDKLYLEALKSFFA